MTIISVQFLSVGRGGERCNDGFEPDNWSLDKKFLLPQMWLRVTQLFSQSSLKTLELESHFQVSDDCLNFSKKSRRCLLF